MGGGKKSKAPKAPNYEAIAQQQGDDSYRIAKDVTGWNRPNQTDQYGNKLTWSQDKNGNWSQQVTMGPQGQALQNKDYINRANSMNLVKNNLSAIGSQGQFNSNQYKTPLSGQFNSGAYNTSTNLLPQYDEKNGKRVSDALYESVMQRARPEQNKSVNDLSTQLRQQGLQPGTQAYDSAMRNLQTSNSDANLLAATNATIGGYDEARNQYLAQLQGFDSRLAANQQNFGQNFGAYQDFNNRRLQTNAQNFGQGLAGYNQPYQNAAALQAIGGGALNPSFAGFSGATGYNPADMLGAANAGYQAQMGGANSSNAKKGSTLGSGLGFAGSMMGGK